MKFLIDCYGGDNAPGAIVDGALIALNNHPELEICFVGNQKELAGILSQKGISDKRISFLNAEDVIGCNEAPVDAIRLKKNSSLVVSFDALKAGGYDGMLSAGNTGAVLSGAVLKIGRIKGLARPALSPTLPTVKLGKVLLLDSGANMDCKPNNLVEFALLGSEFMRTFYGVENPRVALLSVGTEDEKGNELTKAVFAMLKSLPINFVGNMEARDALSGNYDVIVTDGFAGNVLLKSIEGAIGALMNIVKSSFKSSFRGMIGGLLVKKPLKNTLKPFNYQNVGGSILLGTKQLVMKAHGSSKAESINASIEDMIQFTDKKVLDYLVKVTELGSQISKE